MRFIFFDLDLDWRPLLGPGAELTSASEAGALGLGAAVLAFEDADEYIVA